MRLHRHIAPLPAAAVGLGLAVAPMLFAQDDDIKGLGAPLLYDQIRMEQLEPVGQIRDGRLQIDRFGFEFSTGDLYLLTLEKDRPAIAVFLGEGVVRAYPPDSIEHHQIERFIDEDDFLDERFERLVLWFADDTGDQLRALADDTPGRDADDANDLLEDRRSRLLEKQLVNPDSRLLVALLESGESDTARPFLYAQVDTDDRGWLTIEREPHVPEEIRLFRFDERRERTDVWMELHALWDFDPGVRTAALDGFPRNPEVEGKVEENDDDDDDWNARDLGLGLRPLPPDRETWRARVDVSRTDVDLALEASGDVTARAALLVESKQPLISLRLQISRFVEVTDVRWRSLVPGAVDDLHEAPLLDGFSDAPDEPVELTGDQLHFVRERHARRMDDDLYEPHVTVTLPRTVRAGERFIVELAYEGPLVENLRADSRYMLKDTIDWMPNHADNRRSRLSMTFRVPERFQIVSGTTLIDDHVRDDTRVMRWVCESAVRGMSFNFGQFEVTDIGVPDLPEAYLYEDKNRPGISRGSRELAIDDLVGTLQTFQTYFGPYPFDSLRLTEAPWNLGQAFPGLVLLSSQAFGNLHRREAQSFRAHEIAHQWWGAEVDWETYRDQWISEGFSQYSSAVYLLNGLDSEDEYLRMLDAWRLNVLGEVNVGQSLGLRHGLTPNQIRRSDGHEAGPVVIGYRLGRAESPVDYYIVTYEKGALILHMLRTMLTDLTTGDDTRFRTLMRRFVSDHRDEPASTATFEEAVTIAFGEPMTWFFDQWVYGTDIPTYRPDLEVSRVADQRDPFLLHGTIRQEDVPLQFRMLVPIFIRFDDGPPVVHQVMVDAPEVEVAFPLRAEPADVDFNYHHAVLAHVR